MDIKFRNLRADEIEVRVSTVKESGVALLLYKDARADQKLLDETVGPMNWQRSHQSIDGRLYCTISIYDSEKKEWISKQDVGTEAFTEKEKSVASDSFKRAAFNFGCGRELYSAPFIWVPANLTDIKGSNGKFACYDRFEVLEIAYDKNDNITALKIVNSNGIVVYNYKKATKKSSNKTATTKTGNSSAPANTTPPAEPTENSVNEAGTPSFFANATGKKEVKPIVNEPKQNTRELTLKEAAYMTYDFNGPLKGYTFMEILNQACGILPDKTVASEQQKTQAYNCLKWLTDEYKKDDNLKKSAILMLGEYNKKFKVA